MPPAPRGEPVGHSTLFRPGRDREGAYGRGTLPGEYRRLPQSRPVEHPPAADPLPIARTGGGDPLFLAPAPERYGQVLGSAQGLPDRAGLRTRGMAGVPAEDFDAHLDGLFIDGGLTEDLWRDSAHPGPGAPWRLVAEERPAGRPPGRRSRPWATGRPPFPR
ncbi:SMI1/KNR4 family protein [Nocardiopsis composta]|uniref:Uncharacterized protein n=2 Tax=Nocardiopsis composta TaxID=157465 RepID=A0A7W8QIK7_9ACTN|nr:SMI1/KNR4 family protein [Nocardiopsis composta]MBB5431152.1 hypothetical protein [Nocardiopsis composta]